MCDFTFFHGYSLKIAYAHARRIFTGLPVSTNRRVTRKWVSWRTECAHLTTRNGRREEPVRKGHLDDPSIDRRDRSTEIPRSCLGSTHGDLSWRMDVNRRSVHKEIFHGAPNHAIESLLALYRSAKTILPCGRSIDRSTMAITLASSCLHTSTVTTPEFKMSPPTFEHVLENASFCFVTLACHRVQAQDVSLVSTKRQMFVRFISQISRFFL